MIADYVHGGFGGPALGDAADIQLHARLIEGKGSPGRIDMQLAISAVGRSLAKTIRVGQAMLLTSLAPQTNDRSQSRIECSVGPAGHVLGCDQHFQQVVAHAIRSDCHCICQSSALHSLSASAREMPNPMPLPPPVMIAVLFM